VPDADGTVCGWTDGEFTVTSFQGSRGSAQGNTTKKSSASTPISNVAHALILAATPPGILCHSQPYTYVPASAGGSPADFGDADSSRPSTTRRCEAEYFGSQVVRVMRALVGLAAGWSGTGRTTPT
jgi:hypothetical protein